MKNFINWAMKKIQNFDVCEIALFKLSLISFGILIGSQLKKGCKKKFVPFVFLTFIFSYAALVFKMLQSNNE